MSKLSNYIWRWMDWLGDKLWQHTESIFFFYMVCAISLILALAFMSN